MSSRLCKRLFILTVVLFTLPLACKGQSPTTTPVIYTLPQLEYRLFSQFDVFWCDPDYYPIGRPELPSAIEQFPAIQSDEIEFGAILEYLSLDRKNSYTDEEKLLIYRQHKKLSRAVQMTAAGDKYDFVLRVGEGQGWRYEGTIAVTGEIKITSKTDSVNTCPICLTKGTLIDTPSGQIPVEQLRQGMIIWTTDGSGNRVAAPIIQTASTPVPQPFVVVRITLDDGRFVSASPNHPSADGKAIGDYRIDDILDGSRVIVAERMAYTEGATYDILPAGGIGLYWANDILLMSTLN